MSDKSEWSWGGGDSWTMDRIYRKHFPPALLIFALLCPNINIKFVICKVQIGGKPFTYMVSACSLIPNSLNSYIFEANILILRCGAPNASRCDDFLSSFLVQFTFS